MSSGAGSGSGVSVSVSVSTPKYEVKDSSVYEPSEDTFLLIDAISLDAHTHYHNYHQHGDGHEGFVVSVEIGCGSGLPIVHLTMLLNALNTTHHHTYTKKRGVVSLATDINPAAAATARHTASLNGVELEVIETDLVAGLEERLGHSVDFLLFNPPYVITPTEEITSSLAARAWAGGRDGREVTDRFLPLVPFLLSPRGCCYLLLLEQNHPHQVMEYMQHHYSLSSQVSSPPKELRRRKED